MLTGLHSQSYPVSNALIGPRFDGVGAVSGGGATSLLLQAYSQTVRSEIMDYLFSPNFGAAFHILKAEIGGGGLSSEGSEATHALSIEELYGQPNCHRGYEWDVMIDAKERNPSILLYGLSWTWPGYLGEYATGPWVNISMTVDYTLSWIQCATSHGLDIDVIGSWNERTYSGSYLKALRTALDANGFAKTAILCDDAKFACASELLTDPDLFKAVQLLGGHDPATPTAQAVGKPVWFSEDFHATTTQNGGQNGAATWAHQINTRFITYNMTSTIAWNLVDAFYRGLAFDDTGMANARCPWSSNYEILPTIWVSAHTCQFTEPGWNFLPVGNGSSLLEKGGSYVTYVNGSDFSIVIEKFSSDGAGVSAENATFCLGGTLPTSKPLQVWASFFDNGSSNPVYFEKQNQITPGADRCFTINVPVGSLFTITTLTTGNKGSHPTPPPCTDFPLPYTDDFEACVPPSEANFFADTSGSWECVNDGANNIVMRLQTPEKPCSWEKSADTSPVGVFGDRYWRDINVTLDVRLNKVGESFQFAVHGNLKNTSNYTTLTLEYVWPGLWLSFDTSGFWTLADQANQGSVITSGSLPTKPTIGAFHRMSLSVKGQYLSASMDSSFLFTNLDVSAYGASGFVGYGTRNWGDQPDFDNFLVAPS
jgi:galactosylceramidase